jgi:uncharacterized protein (DUF1015 family)
MARVRPFAAWRYVNSDTDISPMVAPPYDVISPSQRETLIAQHPDNVVALELPEGALDPAVPGNRYATGKATWDAWRSNGVLAQDATPCVYVLEQSYVLGKTSVKRRAFIVEVGLEPFSAGVVLPHERTLPKALGDRFNLTAATGANLSQVFGLFDDAACETDAWFEKAMATDPIATATDADGVRSSLWAVSDESFADSLAAFMATRPIFIADGHHRYTTALAYRDLRRENAEAAGEDHGADPAYDFVLMALVNMDDPDLVVLPTHRVADSAGDFDAAAFREALSRHFELEEMPDRSTSMLDSVTAPAFLIKTRSDVNPFLARLRSDVDTRTAIPTAHTDSWKSLDVAVLQELILNPLLDIHPDRAETLERLNFFKNAGEAFDATSDHDVAFVLRATRMDQLREVALSGETMPQKSTYFYPKLLSGLIFRDAE